MRCGERPCEPSARREARHRESTVEREIRRISIEELEQAALQRQRDVCDAVGPCLGLAGSPDDVGFVWGRAVRCARERESGVSSGSFACRSRTARVVCNFAYSVSVSVETRRSDDLYPGASPDGDEVGAER